MIDIKKHLFLIGASGCGKTTMIRNALGPLAAIAGGFVTERVKDENGRALGYDLMPAAAVGGVEGYERLRFLDYTVEPPVHNNEFFRVEAAQMLEEAQYYPFSMIDEFGGFELIIPQFREALADFLSTEQPIIGVIKDFDNAEQLRNHLGLGERYSLYVQRLREALLNDPDTLILQTKGRYDENARRIVEAWVQEYAHA